MKGQVIDCAEKIDRKKRKQKTSYHKRCPTCILGAWYVQRHQILKTSYPYKNSLPQSLHDMLKFTVQVLRILILFISLDALGQGGATFEERAEKHIEDVAGINGLNAGHKQVFAIASANFYQYEKTGQPSFLDKARQLVQIGHDDINAMNSQTVPESDISFGLWMGMDCYLRWSEDYYTDELKDNAKTTFTECRHYDSHNTSNKIMMASSARVLASIEWPNATFASGFNKGDANSTGGIRFADACQKYVQRGEDEYNSDRKSVV